jgi:hypothetical protein
MVKYKNSDLCPLCGEFMDLYCTGHRRLPFVDNKCYDKMCFGCYHIPKTQKQIYDKNGEIDEIKDLPFCYQYLHTANDLLQMGACDTRAQAQKCITGVRAAIRKAKLPRKPPKLKQPPDPGLELNESTTP